MPASIFGDRFFGRREPAWHGIGTVLDEELTATEAMKVANIAFPVNKWEMFAKNPETGELLETDQFAVVRDPTADDDVYRVLSNVGSQWTPLQAWDLAKMLDPVSEKYPVETVGALGNGEKIFFTLDAGESVIAGEDHHLYYLVSDSRLGTESLNIAFTPVRVVCQNTLTVGLSSAKVSASLTHHSTIKEDAEWYTALFAQMMGAKETVTATMNHLAEVGPAEKPDIERIINSAFKDASMPKKLKLSRDIKPEDVPAKVWSTLLNDKKHWVEEWEKRRSGVKVLRDATWDRFDAFNDEFPKLAMTPWAGWQAVCETQDYRKGHKDALGSSIFGDRAESKARAFNEALKVAHELS